MPCTQNARTLGLSPKQVHTKYDRRHGNNSQPQQKIVSSSLWDGRKRSPLSSITSFIQPVLWGQALDSLNAILINLHSSWMEWALLFYLFCRWRGSSSDNVSHFSQAIWIVSKDMPRTWVRLRLKVMLLQSIEVFWYYERLASIINCSSQTCFLMTAKCPSAWVCHKEFIYLFLSWQIFRLFLVS